MLIPVVDRMTRVNMQVVTMPVPAQDGITRDNVTVRVDAVVYFRVIDPLRAVVEVQDYEFAISQVAQTSLRSIIGKSELDDLLSNREQLNQGLEVMLDSPAAAWGIEIDRVEIKDVALPESMKRSMSRQAEAERERRSRIITADGEFQASQKLSEAAAAMADTPAALQLRLLQTMVEVAAEKNSTLVLPFPVEMLRYFEAVATGRRPRRGARRYPTQGLQMRRPDLFRSSQPRRRGPRGQRRGRPEERISHGRWRRGSSEGREAHPMPYQLVVAAAVVAHVTFLMYLVVGGFLDVAAPTHSGAARRRRRLGCRVGRRRVSLSPHGGGAVVSGAGRARPLAPWRIHQALPDRDHLPAGLCGRRAGPRRTGGRHVVDRPGGRQWGQDTWEADRTRRTRCAAEPASSPRTAPSAAAGTPSSRTANHAVEGIAGHTEHEADDAADDSEQRSADDREADREGECCQCVSRPGSCPTCRLHACSLAERTHLRAGRVPRRGIGV